MERSSECRKSLDQLLEQALSERSREDDQVEVTYELTAEAPHHHDKLSLRGAEEEEGNGREDEESFGAVQAERIVMKNTLLLSTSIVFISSGFAALLGLQSSVFPSIGLQSLSVLYLFATLSLVFAPVIVHKIGVNWTLTIVCFLQILYILAFHFYHPAAWVAGSILLGLGLGPLVRAQKTYLTRNISRLTYMTQAMRNKMQQRYLRFFFIISKSHFFWGNLVATLIVDFVSNGANQVAPNATFAVVRRTELCYERLCQNGIRPMEMDDEDEVSSSSLSSGVTMLFVIVFVPSVVVGLFLWLVFLERIEVLQEQDPMERSLLQQTLRQIRLILVDKNVRLALPMLIFVGIEQAFLFGDFSRAYISCGLGVESVPFTLLWFGASHSLGSLSVYLFSRHFQRPLVMAAGLVCQSGLLMVLWLWTPVPDDAAVFYVIAGGWGLCNAVWETLTTTFLATIYCDDWQTPFCTYYQLQWFGMALAYFISPFLCAEIKILILAVFLAVSIVPYTILEFQLHHRNQVQNRTDML